MPINKLEGLDRAFFRFSLRRMNEKDGFFVPMPARGSFGISICPWCGDSEFEDNPFKYHEHVTKEHKSELKPIKKVKQQNTTGEVPQ